MKPSLPTAKSFMMKTCNLCQGRYGSENFSPCHSIFFTDGYLPICNDCIKEILLQHNFSWEIVDKLCQYADIPFVPVEWEKIYALSGENSFPIYAKFFKQQEYENLDWGVYYNAFKDLADEGRIEEELPGLKEKKERELLDKWGPYSPEEYNYLETLLRGLMTTQNINGALQLDQALKICKISLELDNRIRAGQEFDKMLSAYDKLVKAAEFTPKNTKNLNDIDSVGELIKWLEKRGYKCKFYDDVSRDIVDETLKNIQSYNQRLYTNESGIGEEITRRIEMLKTAYEQEKYYDIGDDEYDLDKYDSEGYDKLFEEEEFDPGGDE